MGPRSLWEALGLGDFGPGPHISTSCVVNGAGAACRGEAGEGVLGRAVATPGRAAALGGGRAGDPGAHLWAWRARHSTLGAVGRNAGGAASGWGERQTPRKALPFVWTPSAGFRSAGAHWDQCRLCVCTPFLRNWSVLGSDLGIGSLRPEAGTARRCSRRTRVGSVPNGVCSATARSGPRVFV